MMIKPSKKKILHKHILMGNSPLEAVHTYKYLGLLIDSDLSFQPHVRSIIQRVAHKVKLLSNLRRMLTTHAAKNVYKAIILTLFAIGDVFYHSCTNFTLKKLQVIQNWALRCIFLNEPKG